MDVILLVVGVILLSINLYGIYKGVRPANIEPKHLHFIQESYLTYSESLHTVVRLRDEDEQAYCHRMCTRMPQMLAHIRWEEFDEKRLNQLVPMRENYILYFMGAVLSLPDYKRYHFTDYRRNLRRGIGVCGDACMILSQLLDLQKISNCIVSFRGHVLVEVESDGCYTTYDPDFGVIIPYSTNQLRDELSIVDESYGDAGYDKKVLLVLKDIYSSPHRKWNGVSHFVKKKYYFEKLAYLIKWLFPCLLLGLVLLER